MDVVGRLVLLNLNFIKKHLSTEFYLVSVIRFLYLLSYWFFVSLVVLGLVFIVYM